MLPLFDPAMVTVSDDEILALNEHFGFVFNEGQINYLRHWQTADIQACPGSGKTTTLAAKLILLVNKIPPGFKKGVCVITHTNTAVDEIKTKLGDFTGFYNRYPNHFGTIQSFVDRFLMLPAYRGLFRQTPAILDTETYNKILINHPLMKFKSASVLENHNIYPGSLSFNKFDFKVSRSLNDQEPLTIPKLTKPVMEKHLDYITRAKLALLADGYIKYDEAYAIAFRYLREHPEIKKAVARRFPFVFIDERQDMETHQTEIINALFNATGISLQQVGDMNQAIYGHPDAKDVNAWQPQAQNEVQLTVTNRLPQHIAKLVSPVCLSPQDMTGHPAVKAIKPVILVYDNSSLPFVVDSFAGLILQHGIEQEGVCKCIGFRNSDARLNLQSYWREYNRKKNKTEFHHLISYCYELQHVFKISRNISRFKKILLVAICRGMKIGLAKNPATQKYFTPATLNSYYQRLGKLEGFHTRIGSWVRQIQKGEDIFNSVSAFLNALLQHFKAQETVELTDFLNNTDIEVKTETPDNVIYTYKNKGKSVDLHFDTVHGVKGETHVATLYLETFYMVYDIGDKILPFIAGDEKQQARNRKDKAFARRLPCAYVALTRPTKLLAIAVHKDRFNNQIEKYFDTKESGWNVVYLCDHD